MASGGGNGGGGGVNVWSSSTIADAIVTCTDVEVTNNAAGNTGGGLCISITGDSGVSGASVNATDVHATDNSGGSCTLAAWHVQSCSLCMRHACFSGSPHAHAHACCLAGKLLLCIMHAPMLVSMCLLVPCSSYTGHNPAVGPDSGLSWLW